MSEPLTCHELVKLITEYLEGALSAQDRRRVDEHLKVCEGCRRYLEQMRETIRLSGMLTEEQIPDEQKTRLLEAFRDWGR